MVRAWKRVKANKGSAGADGRTVLSTGEYLKTEWPNIRAALLDGSYRPEPVRRVGIPKPGGGMRVRTGRFEKLRSGEFGCSLWPAPARAARRPPSAFVHAAPTLLHRSRFQTQLHRALPTFAPVRLATARASDAMHCQSSCLVTVQLVRPFASAYGLLAYLGYYGLC